MKQDARVKAVPLLDAVPSTLLIPLVARARGASLFPWLDPVDTQAQQVLHHIGPQVMALLQDRSSVLNVLWRTQLIKQIGRAFFDHYPQAQGVNLGAGLSDYFQWLNNGHNHWLDMDLDDVVTLRHALLPAHSTAAHDGGMDLTQPGWWQQLPLNGHGKHQPLLLVCEGVLMYLTPTQVKAVLREIGENAPEGSELVCDFMTPLGIGRTDLAPSVAGTGAEFLWGAHNALEVARQHPRLELVAQHTVAEAYGWASCWTEMCMTPWTGGPLYGVAHLQVAEP
jgi:O-methyltransferase involved in polyketide biosynthesis